MKNKQIKVKRSWNNKKIALVSILIATSVALVLIFVRIIPVGAIPSFKIMAAGLPIKITGYIFGPWIGAFTGVVSDLLSFALNPVFIHWPYTLAFSIAGFIPGVLGYVMHRRWKNEGANNPRDEDKYNNINFALVFLIILASLGVTTWFVFSEYADFTKSLMKNKWGFYGIVVSGSGSMLIAVILFRIFLKPKTFNALLPIIGFSVILDLINTPLVAYGDFLTFKTDDFLTLLTTHTLLTPFKSWGNMFIIYFAYKMVAPLIFNKTSNGWDDRSKEITKIKIATKTDIKKIEKTKKANKNSKRKSKT